MTYALTQQYHYFFETMKLRQCYTLILMVFLPSRGFSQVTHQRTYWTRFYARVKIDSLYSWQTEADNRRFFGENKQLQIIAHTHLHRKMSKNTEGSLGFTYSAVWQGDLPVSELRPFQEFYIFQPLTPRLRFIHRIRTEQRWFHNYGKNVLGTEALTSGYNFKFRFRYMLRLEYKYGEKWVFKANDELMYHHDDFDQNRVYGAVEYKFKKDMSFEIGYLKSLQKRANNKGYFNRDNVRVTIYKDFNLQ
jgi:Protein of unknown function (DUF2490)